MINRFSETNNLHLLKYLLFLSIILCRLPLAAQKLSDTKIPDTALIRKNNVSAITVYKNNQVVKSDTVNLGKGNVTSEYKFNKKGQLIWERQGMYFEYTFSYPDTLEKFETFYKGGWDPTYSYSFHYYDSVARSTKIYEYEGVYKRRKAKTEPLKTIRQYYDSIGRIILYKVESNKWYFSRGDTGHAINIYTSLDSTKTLWTRYKNYGKHKDTLKCIITTNAQRQIVEINEIRKKGDCLREVYIYKEGLLMKKIRFGCTNNITGIDTYVYTYFEPNVGGRKKRRK